MKRVTPAISNALAALALLTTLAAACGDALVDGAYPGEPLFTISGWVNLTTAPENLGAKDPGGGSLRVAVFWAPAKDAGQYNLPTAIEQAVGADGTFPARFTLSLFEPPSDKVLHTAADGSGQFAVALIVAYLDTNGNHRWDHDLEKLIGGAEQRVLMYTPRGVTDPLFGTLDAGFHRVVPTAACEDVGTGLRYAKDEVPDLDLTVSGDFPSDILFDFDCDGKVDEWTNVCPSLEFIRFNCRDQPPTDESMCKLCLDKLWPVGSDALGCDAWANVCLPTWSSPKECVNDWIECHKQAGAELSQDAGACEAVYAQCKISGPADGPALEICQKHKSLCEDGFR